VVREHLQSMSGLVSNPRRYVKSGSVRRRIHSQNRGARQDIRGPSTARPRRPRNRPPVSSPRRTAGPHRPVRPWTLYIGGFPCNGISHLRGSGKASTAGGDLPALSSPVPQHRNAGARLKSGWQSAKKTADQYRKVHGCASFDSQGNRWISAKRPTMSKGFRSGSFP
jgi:hypothetical protein